MLYNRPFNAQLESMTLPKLHANLSMMFLEFDFFARFEAAHKAGFQAVEMMFPYEYKVQDICTELEKYSLDMKLINMPPGNWAEGERGIAALPDRVEEFRKSVDMALIYAQALKCPIIHCMSGIIPPNISRDICTNVYIENLKYLAAKAKPMGINIMVEAINSVDIPNFLVNNQEQSLAIVQQTGMDNVKMQFDIYHCQMAQGNVATRLIKFLPYIGHVQIADVPGRHEPGTGEINFDFLFNHLDEIGYTGWVGCEYKPRGNTIDGLGWWHEFKQK
ncbi:MAG: hydroxypyruvate isomerase family protein [Hyphomicrobiales bacterium]